MARDRAPGDTHAAAAKLRAHRGLLLGCVVESPMITAESVEFCSIFYGTFKYDAVFWSHAPAGSESGLNVTVSRSDQKMGRGSVTTSAHMHLIRLLF